jgi:enoyl-CoA hydratase
VTVLGWETPGDGILLLRLNRPGCLNALDEVLVAELLRACTMIAADPLTRVVVLTGSGRGFCSGIDVRNFGPSMPEATAPPVERVRFQEMMASLPLAIRALPQPVIAAVNGPAVGAGWALCLASDIRICGRSASFGNAAIRLGLSGAEMGMSYYLPRIVGLTVAADWMLTGRTVSADEAYRSGLVSELLVDERLLPRALELAGSIAAHPTLAVSMTKQALQVNVDAPDLQAALHLENRNQVITHSTAEAAEARRRRSADT